MASTRAFLAKPGPFDLLGQRFDLLRINKIRIPHDLIHYLVSAGRCGGNIFAVGRVLRMNHMCLRLEYLNFVFRKPTQFYLSYSKES